MKSRKMKSINITIITIILFLGANTALSNDDSKKAEITKIITYHSGNIPRTKNPDGVWVDDF